MKMVDFDVAEYQYRRTTKIDEDITRLHYPQKYVLLEAFGAEYSLEIQEVTDTAFFLKLTDDAIKHYTRVEKKIMDENKKLKKENEELKERVKQLQIDNTVINKRYETLIYENEQLREENEKLNYKNDKVYFKAPLYFTQEKQTDKGVEEVTKPIKIDLKERRDKI